MNGVFSCLAKDAIVPSLAIKCVSSTSSMDGVFVVCADIEVLAVIAVIGCCFCANPFVVNKYFYVVIVCCDLMIMPLKIKPWIK